MLKPKELEKLAVDKYLKASKQSYEIECFESPDFILKGTKIKIGCEVTEFYSDYTSKGSNLRKRESYLDRLHKKLRQNLLEQYPKGFSFSVSYKPKFEEKSSVDLEIESVTLSIKENIDSRIVKNPSKNIREVYY